MIELSYLGAFLVGLAGSGHCVGMCGGLSAALGLQQHSFTALCSYHIARLTSYTLMGILLASASYLLVDLTSLQILLIGFRLLAALLMAATALYLLNSWLGLRKIEWVGQQLWRHIAPFSQRLLPLNSYSKIFSAGLIWGFLPCGLVYTMFSWAISSAHPLQGGVIMLAFGAGTLPSMLGISSTANRYQHWFGQRFRLVTALLLLAFALFTLLVALKQLQTLL